MNKPKLSKNHNTQYPHRMSQKGITLVALVITIIILLILAGVGINMAINSDGLFGKANEAAEGWNTAVKKDESSLLDILSELDLITKTRDEDATTIKQKQNNENVYIIQSIEDLVALANNVNTGTTYEGATFELELSLDFNSRDSYINPDQVNFLELGDINGNGTQESLMVELTTGKGFIPIGKDGSHPFKGNIEGKNKTINGLYIQDTESYYAGLIGYANGITINNLSLKNVNISGSTTAAFLVQVGGMINCNNLYCSGKITGGQVGALASQILSSEQNTNIKITNFVNEANLEATGSYAGAISAYASYQNIELIDCINNGNVTSGSNAAGLIGGLSSSNSESILLKNCVNNGNINGSSISAGLLVEIPSINKVEIENCKNFGKIITESSSDSAGLVGRIYAYNVAISNSCNEGEIVNGIGGLFAAIQSSSMQSFSIVNSYNAGDINNTLAYSVVGGVVARLDASCGVMVDKCYNVGRITTSADDVGGIIGYSYTTGTISNCYNTGDIIGDNYVGGIYGYGALDVERCYNKGNITSTGYASGIAVVVGAVSKASVKLCYNEGNIVSSGYRVGGITGGNGSSIIENCYNIGEIEAAYQVGGVCGSELYSMMNCYNLGSVAMTEAKSGWSAGGLSASILWSGSMTNSYNLGKINVPDDNLAVGSITSYKSTNITDCYYLKGTYPIGIYDSSSPDNSGERTEEEIKQLMVDNLVSLEEWELGEDGYPKLRAFPQSVQKKIVVGDPALWRAEGTTIVAYLGDKSTYTDIVIPNYVGLVAVDTIGDGLFYNDSYATSLTISEGIKTIGSGAFSSCSGFTGDLVIPNSVTTIGSSAFSYCSGFTGDLVMPGSVTTIGSGAFNGCSSFTGDLVIPNSVTTIDGGAFYNCTSFDSITIPDTIETVNGGAFGKVKQIYYTGSLDTSSWGAVKVND